MAFTQWAAGMGISAARLAGMTPKYQTWVPAWTTSTGLAVPAYGNAVLNCRYATSGDLVTATFLFRAGSTTSFGGGGAGDNYRFGLPVPAAQTGVMLGMLSLSIASANALIIGARAVTSTQFELLVASGWPSSVAPDPTTGLADAVTPKAWVSGTELSGTLTYEAA